MAKRIAARNARNSIMDIIEYEKSQIQRKGKHKPDTILNHNGPKKKNTIFDSTSSSSISGSDDSSSSKSPVITVKRYRNIHPINYGTSDDDDDESESSHSSNSISSIVTNCTSNTSEKVNTTPANNEIPKFINIDNLNTLQTVNCALNTEIRNQKSQIACNKFNQKSQTACNRIKTK